MTMDSLFFALGKTFCTIGGIVITVLILGLLAYLSGCAWVDASDRWRSICRAESLIHEYRKNRNKYLEWKKEQEENNAAD